MTVSASVSVAAAAWGGWLARPRAVSPLLAAGEALGEVRAGEECEGERTEHQAEVA
jgi:hypothetical protein